MSMIICDRCERHIDSDEQPHCFCDQPDGSTEVICENCQERAYDEHQERLMEDGPGLTLLEQQQVAWRLK